jgi:sugar phosphate isomerase/epimerase
MDVMHSRISRREFLASSVAAGSIGLLAGPDRSEARNISRRQEPTSICIFSKHLQWQDYEGMAASAAEVGFDGVGLTVRPGGHVEPDRVEEELPRAVEAVKNVGLDVPMMTSAITDPNDPQTEVILRTASELGITHYRMGYFRYEDPLRVPARLDELRPVFRDLAQLNREYGMFAGYQNHAGGDYVGAPLWDVWTLVKDLDSQWMGSQFDIRHATVMGQDSWPVQFGLLASHVNMIVAKDFRWTLEDGELRAENCPLGEGVVEFEKYFGMLKELSFAGPISLHLEYPLGGANRGREEITISGDAVRDAMRRDLGTLRSMLAEAGISTG